MADRKKRLVLALQQQRPGREGRALVAAQRAGQRHVVALRHVAAGRDDAMQQRAVVGHQQQARRLLVETADGRDRGVAPPPPFRQQIIDQRTRLLVRARDAERLVQHQHQAGRRIERLAVDAIRVGKPGRNRDTLVRIVGHCAVAASRRPPSRAPGLPGASHSRDWPAACRDEALLAACSFARLRKPCSPPSRR